MTDATIPSAGKAPSFNAETGFAPRHASDRNFFLLLLAAIWGGILAGFIPDSFEHFTGTHVKWEWIVHVHAAVFVGWLVLLTAQMGLIRANRTDLHMKLGLLGAAMIPLMAVLGPWAEFVMANREHGTPDGDDAFLILPIMGIVSFSLVAGAALVFRKDAAAHKRLILLATIGLSDAGFARWLAGPIIKAIGTGVVPFFVHSFFGSIILMAVMGVYDLSTRKKLHPAYVAAVALTLTNHVITTLIYNAPAWGPIATHLIGR